MTTMLRGLGDRMSYRIGNGAGFLIPATAQSGAAHSASSSPVAHSLPLGSVGNRLAVRVVSGNRLMREALAALLRQQPTFSVGTSAPESIRKDDFIPASSREITVLDHTADSDNIVELTRALRQRAPGAGIVVFGIPRDASLMPFVDAGICGFVMQEASSEELVATIGSVAAGRPVPLASSGHTGALAHTVKHHSATSSAFQERTVHLTRREQQIIGLIVEGLCNKEIAARLGITLHTVKSHVHNLLAKLSVDSRLGLAALARRQMMSMDHDAVFAIAR